nr:uncharacterized protein LOC112772501 [Arachis hypogaea]
MALRATRSLYYPNHPAPQQRQLRTLAFRNPSPVATAAAGVLSSPSPPPSPGLSLHLRLAQHRRFVFASLSSQLIISTVAGLRFVSTQADIEEIMLRLEWKWHVSSKKNAGSPKNGKQRSLMRLVTLHWPFSRMRSRLDEININNINGKSSLPSDSMMTCPKTLDNDIDVYLQFLVDELKQLWDGVETYDAKEGNTFKMCAALMWTISDFPGLENLSGWNTHIGKISTVTSKKRRNGQDAGEDDSHWKKKSIFFDLPYWEDQMLVITSIILNDSDKSKDNLKARKDLQCMDIRHELWPDEGGKYSSAIFAMSNSQRDVFLKTMQNVVFQNGYSSNVARCIDLRQRKLSGLKKCTSESDVQCDCKFVIIFFEKLCGKAINPMQFADLQNHIVQTLCQMEMIFPPSFFTVMVHLTMHLVDEVSLGGPIHYQWIYPIKRYLGCLKQYVRNRTQPEGSITEGYLSEKILTFCSRYLDNIKITINRPRRVDDEPVDVTQNSGKTMFPAIGRILGVVSHFELTLIEKRQAHRHVLVNCDVVSHDSGKTFGAYNFNGYKFRTITKEDGLKTQNSGVYVSSNTRSYASMRDNRVVVGSVPYYEKIVDIIELNYSCHFTVVLFKCVWAYTTTSRGIKQYHLGLTSVNFSHPIHTGDREEDEPYILASEAQLVYYVDDEVANEWSVVVHVKPRDLYDIGEENKKAEVDFSP